MAKEKRKDILLRLPDDVVVELDRDAARCRRSRTTQIEAILAAYLGLEDVDLRSIEETRERVPDYGVRTSPGGNKTSAQANGKRKKA